MKATFFVTARNKVKYVKRAVKSAFDQTYPCHIVLSDQSSTDGTYEAMVEALSEYLGNQMPHVLVEARNEKSRSAVMEILPTADQKHHIELVRCPIEGEYGMTAANAHTMWAVERAETPWIFQCSADDYSLPDRVAVCMAKVEEMEAKKQECAAIACTMYYLHAEDAFNPQTTPYMRLPEDMYISAGFGLKNLVYGSTIQGWNQEFFIRAGSAENVTGDVFHGFMAALDKGYFVINRPLHVKVEYADMDNMGFQGKMKAAEKSGDRETMARINELNRFQLFELYLKMKMRQQQKWPMAHAADQQALVDMILTQAQGWYQERSNLHANKWTPGII